MIFGVAGSRRRGLKKAFSLDDSNKQQQNRDVRKTCLPGWAWVFITAIPGPSGEENNNGGLYLCLITSDI
jgi:hypothetical protein